MSAQPPDHLGIRSRPSTGAASTVLACGNAGQPARRTLLSRIATYVGGMPLMMYLRRYVHSSMGISPWVQTAVHYNTNETSRVTSNSDWPSSPPSQRAPRSQYVAHIAEHIQTPGRVSHPACSTFGELLADAFSGPDVIEWSFTVVLRRNSRRNSKLIRLAADDQSFLLLPRQVYFVFLFIIFSQPKH